MDQLTPDALRNNPLVCVKCVIVPPDEVHYTTTEARHVPRMEYDPTTTKVCNAEVAIVTYGDHERRTFPYGGGNNSDFLKRLEKNLKKEKDGMDKKKDPKRASKPPVNVTGPPKSPAAKADTKAGSVPGGNKAENYVQKLREVDQKRNILEKKVSQELANAVKFKKLAMKSLKRKKRFQKELEDFERKSSAMQNGVEALEKATTNTGTDSFMKSQQELTDDDSEEHENEEMDKSIDLDDNIDEDLSAELQQLNIEEHKGEKMYRIGTNIEWIHVSLIRNDAAENHFKFGDRKIFEFIRGEIPFEKLLE